MLGFNGERYDPLTRTYALGQGYRSYSPALMRFQAPDDLCPFGQGGLNAYAYCAGDPVNFVDTSGHAPTAAQLQAKRMQMGLDSISGSDRYQQAPLVTNEQKQHRFSADRAIQKKKRVTFNKEKRAYYQIGQGSFKERAALTSYMGETYGELEPFLHELNFLLLKSTEKMFNRFRLNTSHLKRVHILHTYVRDSRYHFASLNMNLQEMASAKQVRSETLPT